MQGDLPGPGQKDRKPQRECDGDKAQQARRSDFQAARAPDFEFAKHRLHHKSDYLNKKQHQPERLKKGVVDHQRDADEQQ